MKSQSKTRKAVKCAVNGRKAKAARKNPAKRRRGNPEQAAAERYEFFHGQPPDQVHTFETREHRHDVTSGIGRLEWLKIATLTGRKAVVLNQFKGARLTQSEVANKGNKLGQLFIVGGDQSVDLAHFGIEQHHEQEVLGALLQVAYETNKTHLRPEDGGEAVYVHTFGRDERTKLRTRPPLVVYDVPNKRLLIVGGEYRLPAEGIAG